MNTAELVAGWVREVGFCPACNPGVGEGETPAAGPFCTHAARLFTAALAAGEPPAELGAYVGEAAHGEPASYWHGFPTVAELVAELAVFREAGGFSPGPPEYWP